jgi:hypothetical protein
MAWKARRMVRCLSVSKVRGSWLYNRMYPGNGKLFHARLNVAQISISVVSSVRNVFTLPLLRGADQSNFSNWCMWLELKIYHNSAQTNIRLLEMNQNCHWFNRSYLTIFYPSERLYIVEWRGKPNLLNILVTNRTTCTIIIIIINLKTKAFRHVPAHLSLYLFLRPFSLLVYSTIRIYIKNTLYISHRLYLCV